MSKDKPAAQVTPRLREDPFGVIGAHLFKTPHNSFVLVLIVAGSG
jgi:hypothetical protein